MSADKRHALFAAVGNLTSHLPVDALERLATALEGMGEDGESVRSAALRALPQLPVRAQLEALLKAWDAQPAPRNVGQLAALLRGAAIARRASADKETIELLWTGPEAPAIPLRRTDQALLDVIEKASQRLLILSFAVYSVPAIVDALQRAAGRGAAITLCAETSEDSEGRFQGDPTALQQLRPWVSIYHWPADQRGRSERGTVGVLHAKAAVADGQWLYLSSANLTRYALSINLELGVLIHGGAAPGKVEQQCRALIERGILRPYSG